MWFLLACASTDPAPSVAAGGAMGSDPEPGDTGASDSGNPYLIDDGVEPLLSPEEVAEGIGTAISAVLSTSPVQVIDAQEWMLSANGTDTGSGCPIDLDDFYETYGYHYYYGPCESAEGGAYDGYAYWQRMRDWWSGVYHYLDYGYLYGTQSFVSPDAQRFDVGGYAYYYDYTYYTYHYWYGAMYGSFAFDGEAFGSTWLGGELEASYAISAGWYGEGATYLSLSGTIGGFAGPANAAEFDGVYVFDASIGSSCDIEPSGAISVRDADGEWYTVSFDGPAFSGGTVFPADCDGCGDIWYRGELVGEACPDFSGLDGWGEEGPWD